MRSLALLTPELVLCGLALAVMLADMLLPRARARWLSHLSWLSTAAVLALVVASLADPAARGAGALWVVDSFGQFFKVLVLLAATLCLLMGLDYKALPARHAGTFAALMLFS